MLTPEQQQLVEKNMGLAYSISFKFKARNQEDLTSEALLALCKAAEQYNPNNNTSFSTYAYKCISCSCTLYLIKDCLIKPSRVKQDNKWTKYGPKHQIGTLEDLEIADTGGWQQNLISRIDVDNWLGENFSTLEISIVNHLIDGYTARDIIKLLQINKTIYTAALNNVLAYKDIFKTKVLNKEK